LGAVPALALTWWWRTVHKDRDIGQKHIELEIAKREERAKRFVEAVKLLASESMQSRLGAIYSLESLALDSNDEKKRVLETICAFIRTKGVPNPDAPDPPEHGLEQPEDIQVAFDVLGRIRYNGMHFLRRAELTGISARDGSLRRADFMNANLLGADFEGMNFSETCMFRADLRYSEINSCNFKDAQLLRVTFASSKLFDNCFDGANLSGADFSKCDEFGCTFKGAIYDDSTKLPDDRSPEELGMIKEEVDVDPNVDVHSE
jgi:hypothetical protein